MEKIFMQILSSNSINKTLVVSRLTYRNNTNSARNKHRQYLAAKTLSQRQEIDQLVACLDILLPSQYFN